jgi:pimeloyl-ACP methyl ester carboxylesterase
MAQDGVELAEYLHKHLQQKNLVVLGHSWGTILAVEMVKLRPDLFSAYVGTGQVSSWRSMAAAQYAHLQTEALRAQDQVTLTFLTSIGEPDFFNTDQYFSWRAILNRDYLWPSDAEYRRGLRDLTSRSDLTATELQALAEGANFSISQLLKVVMAADLGATASRMPVPFYIIQGRNDFYAPTSPAIEYFNSVLAPKKKLIVIENAGHFALVTHQAEFLNALTNLELGSKRR